MRIYIDESGTFACFPEARNSVSCVAALVVPETVHEYLMTEFSSAATSWGFASKEVKGRLLNEDQFDQAIRLVLKTGWAFLRIAAIDVGLHTNAMIEDHKRRQADIFRASMDERFAEPVVNQVHEFADRIEALPNQLYVESVLLTEIVASVIQTSSLWFSQVDPPALGKFAWSVDAKDRKPTEYENLWRFLVLPGVQDIFLQSQAIFMTEGDYSHFAPYENPGLPEAPIHLKNALANPKESFSSFSVNRIMEDLEFKDSEQDPGLQLVDVLGNCFRRACNQRLQRAGWSNLGFVIMRDPRTDLALQLCTLSHAIPRFYPFEDMPYASTLDEIASKARSYLAPGFSPSKNRRRSGSSEEF